MEAFRVLLCCNYLEIEYSTCKQDPHLESLEKVPQRANDVELVRRIQPIV